MLAFKTDHMYPKSKFDSVVEYHIKRVCDRTDGIELHHMIRKGQMKNANNQTVFDQFFALAA